MANTFRIQASASHERLEKLMEERLRPGADKPTIDARIWDLFGEEWAVMFTDLAGFSRSVAEFGVIHFLQVIHESQRLLVPCIDKCDGILMKMEGDSMLVIFRRPHKAIECAVLMQHSLQTYNLERDDEEKVLLCVGLGYGPMLHIGDHDVFGGEVNAASKLGEDTAKASDILVTESVKQAIEHDFPYAFELLPDSPPGARAAYRCLYQTHQLQGV